MLGILSICMSISSLNSFNLGRIQKGVESRKETDCAYPLSERVAGGTLGALE